MAEGGFEVRVLDGPNLYFPRPAVKLTLRLPGLAGAAEPDALRRALHVGVRVARPGAALSTQRQVLVERVAAKVLRTVAAASGTTRLGLRVRAGAGPDEVVLAYPWRHRERAEVLGESVAEVLGRLDRDEDVPGALDAAVERVLRAPLGRPPDLPSPRIPVVSVTGTNGKTTVTRLLAHLAMTDGYRTGWTNTDGIYVQGELIEEGDWSGPGGARRVLAQPGLELAVLETARGGLLLRGMGVDHNDVSVVTNVSDDHLGMQGIDTLDQLAEVKSVIVGVTRASGWTVLNGDDPRTLAMRTRTRARPWVFSLDPASPGLRAALDAGGRAATVLDGDLVVIAQPSDPDHLVPLADVPLTLSGLSAHNVANALAAMAGGLAIGLHRDAVVAGLQSFMPDRVLNPGRLNLYSLDGVTVVVDLAHNEAGLEALLQVLAGLRAPGAAVRLVLGTAGDRQDSVLASLGELAARGADDVVIGHKERYLRGRTTTQMADLYRQGAAAVGVSGLGEERTELAALALLVGRSTTGDVVGVMCHAERTEIDAWLRERGATPDGPAEVRTKVLAAQSETL